MSQTATVTRPPGYSVASKVIHWLVALVVLTSLPIGLVLDKLPEGPLQDWLFNFHRSLGILILALAFARVAARQAYGTPAPAVELTTFERVASTVAHHLLLMLIFLQPIVGWLSEDAFRSDVSVFGLFTLPHFLPQSDAAYKILALIHKVLGYLMAFVLVAHIGGALMHGFIKRDGVLNRMLPDAWGRARRDAAK